MEWAPAVSWTCDPSFIWPHLRVVRLLFLRVGLELSLAWSLSRELRTIANIGRSGLPQCVSRVNIHSGNIADTPSFIMGNVIAISL
jgi:hypothetical protein